MNDDLRELLSLLNSQSVEYLVIGAHAVAFYGRPRMTEDIDLFLGATTENARRLKDVLDAFGSPIGSDGAERFATLARQLVRLGSPRPGRCPPRAGTSCPLEVHQPVAVGVAIEVERLGRRGLAAGGLVVAQHQRVEQVVRHGGVRTDPGGIMDLSRGSKTRGSHAPRSGSTPEGCQSPAWRPPTSP